MAGSYPDVPQRRMAYDADGTLRLFGKENENWPTPTRVLINPWIEASEASNQNLNDEGNNTPDAYNPGVSTLGYMAHLCFIFPELRDVYGFFTALYDGSNGAGYWTERGWQTSVNTTNGIDGDWINWYSYSSTTSSVWPDNWRTLIRTPSTVSNIRAATYFFGANRGHKADAVHIYGDIAAGETPDRLLFIDVDTGLEFDASFDWGDVPRGTTLEHDIRIKNNSSTLTANTIVLDFEALFGSADTWYTMDDSGGGYGTTVNITSIAAGVTYPTGPNVIAVRLTLPGAAALGPYAARLKATTTSWS